MTTKAAIDMTPKAAIDTTRKPKDVTLDSEAGTTEPSKPEQWTNDEILPQTNYTVAFYVGLLVMATVGLAILIVMSLYWFCVWLNALHTRFNWNYYKAFFGSINSGSLKTHTRTLEEKDPEDIELKIQAKPKALRDFLLPDASEVHAIGPSMVQNAKPTMGLAAKRYHSRVKCSQVSPLPHGQISRQTQTSQQNVIENDHSDSSDDVGAYNENLPPIVHQDDL